jgi:hypothetical protein
VADVFSTKNYFENEHNAITDKAQEVAIYCPTRPYSAIGRYIYLSSFNKPG